MSKLHQKYISLKNANSEFVYLFKVGVFYLALQDDAINLAEKFDFKLLNLNESVVKVGFPVSRLEYYTRIFQQSGIQFKIVDNTYGVIENYTDYLNNETLKEIVNGILEIDFNNTTFKDAFELLLSYQNKLKKINQNGGD